MDLLTTSKWVNQRGCSLCLICAVNTVWSTHENLHSWIARFALSKQNVEKLRYLDLKDYSVYQTPVVNNKKALLVMRTGCHVAEYRTKRCSHWHPMALEC